MKHPRLFISYRRTDAIDAVRALYFQLRLRFGSTQVFMDVSAISAGDAWPRRLRRALAESSVVLAVIGPTWLKTADEFGRRRLDLETDWVRLEIETALDDRKTVIPVLVGGLLELPPVNALPKPLARLLSKHQHVLSAGSWETDVGSLANLLMSKHGFKLVDVDVVKPIPDPQKSKSRPLSEEQLFSALQRLPGWEPVETSTPRDYPKTRHELRRGFRFSKFRHAIEFLQLLVGPLQEIKHHPRIENQWRTVFIYFTTWDAGNRITASDVKAARLVNRIHSEFSESL